MRDALQTCARYARIVTEGPQFELVEEGDVATIRLTLLRGETPVVRLSAEFVTVGLLRLARRFVGSAARARRVYFAYESPAHRAEYARVFGGCEQFRTRSPASSSSARGSIVPGATAHRSSTPCWRQGRSFCSRDSIRKAPWQSA